MDYGLNFLFLILLFSLSPTRIAITTYKTVADAIAVQNQNDREVLQADMRVCNVVPVKLSMAMFFTAASFPIHIIHPTGTNH